MITLHFPFTRAFGEKTCMGRVCATAAGQM
jgi:hypothetical protein